MAPSITEPASAFKRADGTNKWWSEEEEKILVNRLLRDDPTKGDMNNRTAVSARGMWEALTTYDLWPIFIVSGIRAVFYMHPSLTVSTAGHLCLDSFPAHCKLSVIDSA